MKIFTYALIAMATVAVIFGCNDSERNRKDRAMSDAGKDQKKEEVKKSDTPKGTEVATLGGGCFWCLEAVFERLKGVEKVESGYSGGTVPNPTYEQVCRKDTGHAEVVQVTFDPAVLSFRDLLDVFFAMHDPTTPNQQGYDVGPQYRSAIFYHSLGQKQATEECIAELDREKIWSSPIVTEVTAFKEFYPAEANHQHYYENNPNAGYCMFNISPKVAKLRKKFKEKLR